MRAESPPDPRQQAADDALLAAAYGVASAANVLRSRTWFTSEDHRARCEAAFRHAVAELRQLAAKQEASQP